MIFAQPPQLNTKKKSFAELQAKNFPFRYAQLNKGENLAEYFIVQFNIFTIILKKQMVKIAFCADMMFLIMSHQQWFNFTRLFYMKVTNIFRYS